MSGNCRSNSAGERLSKLPQINSVSKVTANDPLPDTADRVPHHRPCRLVGRPGSTSVATSPCLRFRGLQRLDTLRVCIERSTRGRIRVAPRRFATLARVRRRSGVKPRSRRRCTTPTIPAMRKPTASPVRLSTTSVASHVRPSPTIDWVSSINSGESAARNTASALTGERGIRPSAMPRGMNRTTFRPRSVGDTKSSSEIGHEDGIRHACPPKSPAGVRVKRDNPTDADQQHECVKPRGPERSRHVHREVGGDANRCYRDGPEPRDGRDDLRDHLRAPGLFGSMVTIGRSSCSADDSVANSSLG